LSRSLVALDQNSTIIAVVELSQPLTATLIDFPIQKVGSGAILVDRCPVQPLCARTRAERPHWFGGPIKPEYLTDRLGANLDGMLSRGSICPFGFAASGA